MSRRMVVWLVALPASGLGFYLWYVMQGVLGMAAWPWLILAIIPIAVALFA